MANKNPVEFASRLLTAHDVKYSTKEREALAVVWAFKKFRGYLEETTVTTVTVLLIEDPDLKKIIDCLETRTDSVDFSR